MPRNHKLTGVIGAKTVQVVTAELGKLVIQFDDQSTGEAPAFLAYAHPRARRTSPKSVWPYARQIGGVGKR